MKKVIKLILVATGIIYIITLIFADPTPGPPTGTAGKRVLVIYTSDVGFSTNIYTAQFGFRKFLNDLGFLIEEIGVPINTNSGQTFAGAPPSFNQALPLTPENYCLVLDLRFSNQNVYAGAQCWNYVRGDTIVQADVDKYAAYVAAGGNLIVTGDNYWDPGGGDCGGLGPSGFVSRMENMHVLFNAVLGTSLPDSHGWRVGPQGPLAVHPTGSQNIITDYNTLTNANGLAYSGYYLMSAGGIPAANVWAIEAGDSNRAVGMAWENVKGGGGTIYILGR